MTTTLRFTSEKPREVSFLVYFNGIETPAEAVSVRMAAGSLPEATINVLPDVELRRLGAEDRIQVQIFYLDDVYSAQMGLASDYRLLFEGDIVGWRYSNTARGRQMSFNAVNHLKILDELRPFFMTGLDSLAVGAAKTADGKLVGGAALAQAGPLFPSSILYSGLDLEAKKMIRRPYDLVENTLRACIGLDEQEKFASVPAVNFFAQYVRRTGLHNRFVPSPILEIDHMRLEDDIEGVFPILRYVRFQDTLETLQQRMNQMQGGSMLRILQDLFARMYYELLAITTAPIAQVSFSKSGSVRGEILGPPLFFGETPLAVAGRTIAAEMQSVTPNRILNYITLPQWIFGIPPMCNIVFPSMIQQLVFEENYDQQPTRMYVNDQWMVNALKSSYRMAELAIPSVGYPNQVQRELLKREHPSTSGNILVSGKNLLVWPEEYFKGPRLVEETLPDWFMILVQSALKNPESTTEIPPLGFDNKMLEQLGWAVTATDGRIINTLTNEELPYKPGDIDFQNGTFTKAVETTLFQDNPGGDAGTDRNNRRMKIVWLMQLYAQYEFQRRRTAARNGAVSMIFDPYILPGFTSVIFDEVVTGNHVTAYITSVTHELTKASAGTTVQYTHAQLLDEYLLGILSARTGENTEARTFSISASPPNPFPEVRAVQQVMDRAEEYFRTLLHQKKVYDTKLKTAAFRVFDAVDLQYPTGESVSLAADFAQDTGVLTRSRVQYVKDAFARMQRFVPSEAYKPMFDEATSALRLVSRPICTLDEFISFHTRGDRTAFSRPIEPGKSSDSKAARYYDKILALEQGPGTPPLLDENNYPVSPVTADTRADWETRLKNYRKKVYLQLHPQEA